MSVIRRFNASEWKLYREIRLRALKESPDAFGSTFEEASEYADADWIRRLEAATTEQDYPMAATSGDRVVGLAWARIESAHPEVAHLYQMWVAPECRGKGLGRALVESGIQWARDRRSTRMVLEVTCGDRPARRLYERLGFRPVGTARPMRKGSGLLEQTMELRLP